MPKCGYMEFAEFQSVLRRHRNIVVFAAFAMLVAALDLMLNSPVKGRIEILALPFLAGAFFLLAVVFWPSKARLVGAPAAETLASRFLRRMTLDGRLVSYFPLAGIAIIALDALYNAFLSPTPSIQIHDTVTILFGVSLVAYPFVPERFGRERDFTLLFFLVLVLILVVPLMAVRLYRGNFDEGVNAYSWTMLAPELQAILRLLGINTDLRGDPAGSSAPGLLLDIPRVGPIWLIISTACSGIYSFSIFASAFTAFVLTEFNKTNWRVWTLLVLGFVTAYFANLLRMTVIVAAGYMSSTPQDSLNAMMIAHSNAGWLIFLGWIALFWVLMYRFLFPRKKQSPVAGKRTAALCPLCNEPLSPTITGTKCECGVLYHSSCIQRNGHCPACNRPAIRPDADSKPLT